LFAGREVSPLIAKTGEARLKVRRQGVVHLTPNALLFQTLHKMVPPGISNHELVIDMTAWIFERKDDGLRQKPSVFGRISTPGFGPPVEVTQLYPQHGRL